MINLKDFPVYPESYLKLVSSDVTDKEEAQTLRTVLEDNFPKNGAYAVAGVQIGIPKKAFLAKFPSGSGEFTFVCNPKILRKDREFLFRGEGCLSFPGKHKDTIRYEEIKVKYYDENMEERTIVAEGTEAVIFQHEIDHFDGVLWKDRTPKPITREHKKVGRNDPCTCGSNKKYKKCCLK